MLEGRKKELGDPVVEPPEHNRALLARVQYLVRLESLINVGCKFGPNDLPARVWDELLAMALERQFMDALVEHRRERSRAQETAISKARQQTGLPGPGQTIFETSRPFR
jgi:hypothetical protein